ncbi:MAG: hypothetical protein MJ187_03430, partial [Alphaproteobacteria bacterium]|nr:hypothetical protein [Alphaproteobacteria bacterium]
MHKLSKFFGISWLTVLAVMCTANVDAATGRGGATTSANRARPLAGFVPVSAGTTGNYAGSVSNNAATNNNGAGNNNVGSGTNTPGEDTSAKCGIFTVSNCMDYVQSCIEGGALPHGMNDLFNEDLRNSIMNGMNLCATQVDKCINDVQVLGADKVCNRVYKGASDVWIDFNSRKVQPEYYSFVLRKTGLTPHQAENTCLLLDRNTYGKSFGAVGQGQVVTGEYNDKINAYNGSGDMKSNPQGVSVNENGDVDADRGYYARWDATNGECLVRVAAYKEKGADKGLITNKWLFGAMGNDDVAEAWKPAGESFTCNKDLFGFGLLNTTSTVAVTAVGGGAITGGVLGATAFSNGKVESFDCKNDKDRQKLHADLVGHINDLSNLKAIMPINTANGGILSKQSCEEIIGVRNNMSTLRSSVTSPATTPSLRAECKSGQCVALVDSLKGGCRISAEAAEAAKAAKAAGDAAGDADKLADANTAIANLLPKCVENICNVSGGTLSGKACFSELRRNLGGINGVEVVQSTAWFKTIVNTEKLDNVYCTSLSGDCVSVDEMKQDLSKLEFLNDLEYLDGHVTSGTRVKNAAIGATVGAAAGGVATAISAFVERDHITCHIGDNLDTVKYGKSQKIDSLKDFYVKWALRLPDTVKPVPSVSNRTEWNAACHTLTNSNDCRDAQISHSNNGKIETISAACEWNS